MIIENQYSSYGRIKRIRTIHRRKTWVEGGGKPVKKNGKNCRYNGLCFQIVRRSNSHEDADVSWSVQPSSELGAELLQRITESVSRCN